MSARRAVSAPIDEPLASSARYQSSKPRLRGLRLAVFGLVLTLLAFLGSAVVLLFCPPVLEALSAIVLKPQSGLVAWNGHDRITLVAMGLTQRTTEPARTDTLLVMDIDPAHRHVTMLSVPRDLWVNIPGYNPGKLANAYAIGGPKLAAYTLEHEFGIPVDYTAAMKFHGFMDLVDAMGGVNVTVPQELKDPLYPCLTGYAYCPIDIKPGAQHMTGATALEFVRERHAFAQQDLARVKDQQAFSEAVKRQIMYPTTWPRFPAILNAFTNSLITNVPLNDLPAIGAQYILAGSGNLDHEYINVENGLVQTGWSSDGQSILEPTTPNRIPALIHRLFSDSTLAQENASVAVLNGSTLAGAAADLETTLQGLGFHTVSAGNDGRSNYTQSVVIENTAVGGAADYTARRLQRIMNAQLIKEHLPGQSARLEVIVGSDFPATGTGTGQ